MKTTPRDPEVSRLQRLVADFAEHYFNLHKKLQAAEAENQELNTTLTKLRTELEQLRTTKDIRSALTPAAENLDHLHIPAFHANRRNRTR